MYGKSNRETYITICKIDSNGNLLYGSGNSNRALYQSRGLGWGGRGEGEGREVQKGGDVHMPMADSH